MFWVDFLPILCRVLAKTLVQLDFLAKISKNVQSTERNTLIIRKYSVNSKFLIIQGLLMAALQANHPYANLGASCVSITLNV